MTKQIPSKRLRKNRSMGKEREKRKRDRTEGNRVGTDRVRDTNRIHIYFCIYKQGTKTRVSIVYNITKQLCNDGSMKRHRHPQRSRGNRRLGCTVQKPAIANVGSTRSVAHSTIRKRHVRNKLTDDFLFFSSKFLVLTLFLFVFYSRAGRGIIGRFLLLSNRMWWAIARRWTGLFGCDWFRHGFSTLRSSVGSALRFNQGKETRA